MSFNHKPILVQEQKHYTLQELVIKYDTSIENTVNLIKKLKEYGIIKTVKKDRVGQNDMSELYDEDIAVADVNEEDNHYHYVFRFVGIVVIGGIVIRVYPKYIKNEDPNTEIKTILKVLEKYNSENEIIKLYNETNEGETFNLLALLYFFVKDYFENGLYHNSEMVFEINGRGEIKWEKTINDSFVLIRENRPYYTELHTINKTDDDNDFFKRLHKCIITNSAKALEDCALLDVFELPAVDLSDEIIEDFGDKEYILYRIERELNVQFNSWKQMILKAMYTYISNESHLTDVDCTSIYGTTSFNLVWEHVCGSVFGNIIRAPLKNLKFPRPLEKKYSTVKTLLNVIEKPTWTYTGKNANDTLIPDIILIEKVVEGNYKFIILDAKYYAPILKKEKMPTNQPGIESITKQYLYQLAYSSFLYAHGFTEENIKNCFILPTDDPTEIEKGEVSMQMFETLPIEPKLQPIKVRYLLSSIAYKHYLEDRKIDVSILKL